METTKVYSDLVDAYLDPKVRVIALKGSTRSGKTFAVLQFLDWLARKSKRKNRTISVVSETMPHLKRGAIRDYRNILTAEGDWSDDLWHDTDKVRSYPNAQIEFFSADQPSKVTGPARDILYINECIHVDWEIYRQLAIRTTEKIILDYNPAFEFWVDDKLSLRDDVVIIHSTYKDNDMLTEAQIAEIESNMDDADWWQVYGLGERGTAEGLCWRADKWDIVQKMPSEFVHQCIGLDFGFTNPCAIMHIGQAEQEQFYINQIAYRPKMDNPDIAKAIKDAGLGHLKVICDSAEPKSISELRNLGINAVATVSKDVKLGLQIVNRYMKHYTASSVEAIDENRKYRRQRDKLGNYIDEVVKKFDHAKDAERYAFITEFSQVTGRGSVTSGRKDRRKQAA